MSAITTQDRIAELEQRIAALEAQAVADTLQPNVITVAANGQIGADFSGDVQARTFSMEASNSLASITVTNEIRWLRQSDGALIATVGAGAVGPPPPNNNGEILAVSVYAQGADQKTELDLQTIGTDGIPVSLVQIRGSTDAAPASNTIWVQARDAGGAYSEALLIDGDNNSSFVQMASAQKLEVRLGGVNADGTTGSGGTGDWSATHNSTGTYTVTYHPAFLSYGLVFVEVIKGSGFVLSPEIVDAIPASFEVQFFDPGTNVRDTSFYFLALGA
jgi:hypothetical protein